MAIMNRRASGILLHITSLPGDYGVGDFGSGAYRFADFLSEAGQHYWQILPLNITDPEHQNSPYHSISAFALNPLFISPELLQVQGLLDRDDLRSPSGFPEGWVDYCPVTSFKRQLCKRTVDVVHGMQDKQGFREFCRCNDHWLEDFSLFSALKSYFGGRVWNEWPEEIRDRKRDAIVEARNRFQDAMDREKCLQYLLFKQWASLKSYCNQRNVQIIGDMPIYVVYDSADVWSHPELFKLDENKRPYAVAGVPPDYFSETGQLWGNPVYRWDTLKETGYEWWVQRIKHNVGLYDYIRIDHFRGFVAFWEVPAGEETATRGRWVEAPALDFFQKITGEFPSLPLIAEDLGVITDDVREVMSRFGFPGMKILLFAFGQDLPTNPYVPHNHVKDCIVYTGTHDNNTVKGWFRDEISLEDRGRLERYLGEKISENLVHWIFVRLAMTSVANTAIFPMQDILGLGEEARMNRPATRDRNWRWRLMAEQITSQVTQELRDITEICGRL